MLKKRSLERITKSFANYRRIQILDLLDNKPELSLSEIAKEIKVSLKLANVHVRQLTISGLAMKKSHGKYIRHKLTDRGNFILTFLRSLD